MSSHAAAGQVNARLRPERPVRPPESPRAGHGRRPTWPDGSFSMLPRGLDAPEPTRLAFRTPPQLSGRIDLGFFRFGDQVLTGQQIIDTLAESMAEVSIRHQETKRWGGDQGRSSAQQGQDQDERAGPRHRKRPPGPIRCLRRDASFRRFNLYVLSYMLDSMTRPQPKRPASSPDGWQPPPSRPAPPRPEARRCRGWKATNAMLMSHYWNMYPYAVSGRGLQRHLLVTGASPSLLALHKPKASSSRSDERGRKTVYDLLPPGRSPRAGCRQAGSPRLQGCCSSQGRPGGDALPGSWPRPTRSGCGLSRPSTR